MANPWDADPVADVQKPAAPWEADAPVSAPLDHSTANRSFARVLTDALGKVKTAAGDVAETVNAGVEATANTIVGLGSFPVALVGAGLHTAQEWLNGNKDVSFDKSFGEFSNFLNSPLYERSSSKGQDYTDAVGDMINRVLIPLGGHMAVHPAAPIGLSERIKMVAPMIRDEFARKISGQTVDAADMHNNATIIAGEAAKPHEVAAVESSLREVYDKTGIGPFTLRLEADRDPALRAELMDPKVDVPSQLQQYVDVWHGSPYVFQEFDSSRIGAGEGAQAYGHGLYLAESKGVAASYQKGLSSQYRGDTNNWTKEGRQVSLNEFINDFKYEGLEQKQAKDAAFLASEFVSGNRETPATLGADTTPFGMAVKEAMRELDMQRGGSLYRVQMPADMQERMLDWDKPLSEQAALWDALEKSGAFEDAKAADFADVHVTGEDVYKRMVAARGGSVLPGGSRSEQAVAAASALREAGIPGIKYLDQGSRGTGEGTRNFVVFPGEEKNLKIVDRNGEPVKPMDVPEVATFYSGLDPTRVLRDMTGLGDDVKQIAKGVTDGVVNSAIGQEVVRATMPMLAGVDNAKVAAQQFANAMRNARYQWQRISEHLEKTFTPEERKAMWEAADEQNVLLTEGMDPTGKGLGRLTPKQRQVMDELHELAEAQWKRAQDAGLVQGEGVPYWAPRMAVLVGEDGEFKRPTSGEGAGKEGKNLRTSASSAKQRKHLTAEETEAAMKAKLGEEAQLVRDILTMPLAMSRMGEAIAGREFVNQIKEYGQVSGKDIISETGGPGYITIDHPAFKTYKPEFITDAEGKVRPLLDENGDPVLQKVPLKIAEDWAGPIQSVLSTADGNVYKAIMLLKSKAMTAIMASPAAHNMVIWGRALAYDPANVITLRAYFSGHALAKDAALMTRAINDGLVPIGAQRGSMLDITDVARTIGREGGWGDPNQSWVSLAAQKAGNVFKEGLGDTLKQRIDAFGDFWHHTLLWKQVGALQIHIYNDYYNHMIAQGHPPEVAGPVAANLANRYSGAVASENSSAMVRKALNVMLFSRSFNVGNVGAVHDAVYGLPAGLRAKMFAEAGAEAAQAGVDAAVRKARMGLVADLGMSMLLTAAASAGVMTLLQNQTVEDVKNGYMRRLQEMVQNIKEHPTEPDSYNPYRILPTWDNEPDKRDRIDLGAQPGGRHEYLRLPTGKVVEDTIGWLFHLPTTAEKKLSPLVKGIWEAIKNDKGYGVPVEDPEGGTLKHIVQGLQHVIEAQLPMDTLKTLHDVITGHGTKLDEDKLLGFATGFSTSQGNPHGPEGAVYQAQQERIKQQKAYVMEDVKALLKRGDEAAAYEKLKSTGMSPRDIVLTIRGIQNPRQGLSKQQARRFAMEATEEDQAAMNKARQVETTQ